MNDKIAKINALRAIEDEVLAVYEKINDIVAEKEKELSENVDAICRQIEKDLEDLSKLTDTDIYETKHLGFQANGHWYGVSFNGKTNSMYFMDQNRSWGTNGDDREYHIVIAEHRDASGYHYYEDGKWRETSKEFFASNWKEIKPQLEDDLVRAYKNHQDTLLKKSMDKLHDVEQRLAATQNEK